MTSELLIEFKNVGLKFNRKKSLLKAKKDNDFWALKDVSFKLYRGEVLGVLGKNGAGKSTLLSLLAGITSPSRGEIISQELNASLLSLQAGFVPFLSGRKNIILSGMILGMDHATISNLIAPIIEFADIGEFIDQPVVTYSAGMKARLGFSIAININPDIILIDEVLGVGDKDFRKKSSSFLRNKLKGDTTAVIVSHSEDTIKELCDRVIVIEHGVTVWEGNSEVGLSKF